MHNIIKKILKVVFLLVCLIISAQTLTVESNAQENDTTQVNRYNVVVVLDGSKSIEETDPENLRFEAVKEFVGLLTDSGNSLGGVVFAEDIVGVAPITNINGSNDKKKVSDFFETSGTHAWTNIGAGLSRAVMMLESEGDKNLPSVIVFLSDGNTELSSNLLDDSLTAKANAIQAARESKIPIYSVSLNANGQADSSEMEQISSATNGVFKEIRTADDLKGIFNDFYNMIYGTATKNITNKSFPENGIIEESFSVPGFGVEEVNIVISGSITDFTLKNPLNEEATGDSVEASTFRSSSLVKIKEVIPGEWMLRVVGEPGNSCQIDMVYNTNLEVDVNHPEDNKLAIEEDFDIVAKLRSGTIEANQREQYEGFIATLRILDSNGTELKTKEMTTSNDGFNTAISFDKGAFQYQVVVEGNGLKKSSEMVGPIAVNDKPNTAPKEKEKIVEETVYVWPFKGGQLTIDLNSLFTDKEDEQLACSVDSTSFLENGDFKIEENVLTQDKFSLNKGSYIIRAVDSGGLTADVELIVISHNVGTMALIGLGILAVIILGIIGLLFYIALHRRFAGSIQVSSIINGIYSAPVIVSPKLGRCKLRRFNLPVVANLDYSKSYFQATSKNFIYLKLSHPLDYNGVQTKKVKIYDRVNAEILLNSETGDKLIIRFESRLKTNR